jgi:hypothetical protein
MISQLFALIAIAFFSGGITAVLVNKMMRHLEWSKPVLPGSISNVERAKLHQRIILCVWTVSSFLFIVTGYMWIR